jgi:cytochrome oxidase Cu insertion factor (SCO1/SenC/PrrC family)
MNAKYGMVLGLLVTGLLLSACGDTQSKVLKGTHVDSDPLAVGDTAPDFTLPEAAGAEVSLSTLLEQGPVLLYFNMAYG